MYITDVTRGKFYHDFNNLDSGVNLAFLCVLVSGRFGYRNGCVLSFIWVSINVFYAGWLCYALCWFCAVKKCAKYNGKEKSFLYFLFTMKSSFS